VAPRRTVSPRRVHRHQHDPPGRAGGDVLQPARPAEQHIKEGKNAVNWTRLSCRRFAANAVRLQLHALAYNLANFLRTLALPEAVSHWSMTTLRDRLVKIGAKIVRHGRSITFQMAEVMVPRDLFQKILDAIAALRPLPVALC
jgi:Transposase DDE domain group 1